MAKRNWDKVANEQFESMPDNFKNDWKDLIKKVNR